MTTFKANRKFPNPITVTDDPKSHTLALQQIIEALNVGQRRTREVGSSYVRVHELVDAGLIEIVGNQLKLTNLGSQAVAAGASALADLTDVDLTGLADGETLVWDSGAGMWVPGAASSGPITGADMYDVSLNDLADVAFSDPQDGDVLTYDAASGVWTIGEALVPVSADSFPTTANSMDDEFEGPTLDSKWVAYNLGSVTGAFRKGALVLTIPTEATGQLRGYEQTLPSGNWRFETKISHAFTGANTRAVGWALRENATAKMLNQYRAWSAGAAQWSVSYWTNASTYSSSLYSNTGLHTTNGYQFAGWQYYAIEYDGTNYYFEMSDDGVVWLRLATAAKASYFTADRIALVMFNGNAGSSHSMAVDFFRRVS